MFRTVFRILAIQFAIAACLFMMSSASFGVQKLTYPLFQTYDANGNPITGCIYTYEAGSTATPKTTYSDRILTVANTNPIIANSRGDTAEIFFNGRVKVVYGNPESGGTCPATPDAIWTKDHQEGQGATILGFHLLSEYVDSDADGSLLDQAIASISSTETQLYLDTDDTLAENLVSPVTLKLIPVSGKKITTGTKTLSIANWGGLGHMDQVVDQSSCTGNNCVTFEVGSTDFITPELFGGKADNSTDSGTEINAAINATETSNIPVHLAAGTYVADEPIIIKNYTSLLGAGRKNTTIKAKAGLNHTVVETYGFSTLTLQNKWTIEDGVVAGFHLVGLTIDGNRDNQTAGSGLDIYAKNFWVDDLQIYDAWGEGWYSETGTGGNTFSSPYSDISITNIGHIWIYNTGLHGFHFRGPHDAFFQQIVVAHYGMDPTQGDAKGAFIEADDAVSPARFNGLIKGRSLHVWGADPDATTSVGFYANDVQFRIQYIEAETSGRENVILAGNSSQIGSLLCYEARAQYVGTDPIYSVIISGYRNQISNLRIHGTHGSGKDPPAGLLYMHTGTSNVISNMVLDGYTHAVEGLRLASDRNIIIGQIRELGATASHLVLGEEIDTSGTGAGTKSSSPADYNQLTISFSSDTASYGIEQPYTGTYNLLNITSYLGASGEFLKTGTNVKPIWDVWNVISHVSGGDNTFENVTMSTEYHTIADEGTGANATDAWVPTSPYGRLICSDTQGCTITLPDTGIPDGFVFNIINISTKPCLFECLADVLYLAGAASVTLGINDSLTLRRTYGRWIEIGRSNN